MESFRDMSFDEMRGHIRHQDATPRMVSGSPLLTQRQRNAAAAHNPESAMSDGGEYFDADEMDPIEGYCLHCREHIEIESATDS